VCGAMPARGVEMCDVGMVIGRSLKKSDRRCMGVQ
jgi:hypothetical protein